MALRETGSLRLNPPEAVERYLEEALDILDRSTASAGQRDAVLPTLLTLLAQRQVTIEQADLRAGVMPFGHLPQQ
jgi:hypothetical protein